MFWFLICWKWMSFIIAIWCSVWAFLFLSIFSVIPSISSRVS